MSEAGSILLRLKSHPKATGRIELRWIPGAMDPPYHGAWLPFYQGEELQSLLNNIPAESHRNLRVLHEEAGWFIFLLRGHLSGALTPWPLKRLGDGPFIFHPAEAAPSPGISPTLLTQVCAGSNLVGRVQEGRILWSRWNSTDTCSPGDLLRLPLSVKPFDSRTLLDPTPFPGAFPSFIPEKLPTSSRFESEEQRRLGLVQDPPKSFWSRLFKQKQPPSSGEWKKLLKAEGSAIRRGIRSFWAWVDTKVGPLPAGASPGFLRRIFDPDQWGISPWFFKNLLDRQAAMFDRLARLFERGDLDFALKHSIPIDNDLVNALKRSGDLSLSWQLPENLVDYSFASLSPPGGRSSVPISSDRIAFMSDLYRKAAERLSAEGRHRQAAYTYAHLLKNYLRAAEELEKGGFHLEAATLLKEKLQKPVLAAQVLERGGYLPEAVRLYIDARAFELAIEACLRAGMQGEADRCQRLWLEDLQRRGERLQAGDLLRDRFKDVGAARKMYQEELCAPKGFRGEAGGRLVALAIDTGQMDLQVWGDCESILRSELQHPDHFDYGMSGFVRFHQEVRKYSKERRLPDALRDSIFRKSRESLLSAVREAQRMNSGDARGKAVGALTELLSDGSDPLAVHDLRRGLKAGLEVSARRHPVPRRRSAGILPLPGGGYFCWVLSSWAWMDAAGTIRTQRKGLGNLVVSAAIHPVPDPAGEALAALVTHDHRISIVKIGEEHLTMVSSGSARGAHSVVSYPERPAFLVGTSEGMILRVSAPKPKEFDTTIRFNDSKLGRVRWLGWWSAGETLLAICDGAQIEDFKCNSQDALEHSDPIPSPIGPLELLVLAKSTAFCISRTREFAILRHNSGAVERLEAPGIPTAGICSAAWAESDSTPDSFVVLGYEDGRVAVAELSVETTPSLRLEKLFRTSLGPVVALRGLDHGRVIAIDVEFNCAIIDTRSLTLTYQGVWKQG